MQIPFGSMMYQAPQFSAGRWWRRQEPTVVVDPWERQWLLDHQLGEAIKSGEPGQIRARVLEGGDINNALVEVVGIADLRGIRAALGEGANINHRLSSPIPLERRPGPRQPWTYKDITLERASLLMHVISRQNSRRALELLTLGADPSIEDENGWTALEVARVCGLTEVQTALEAKGASRSSNPAVRQQVDQLVEEGWKRRPLIGGLPF